MPRLNHKPVQYPISTVEYHIVTKTGTTICIYDEASKQMAYDRLSQLHADCKLIAVHQHKYDVTPMELNAIMMCA